MSVGYQGVTLRGYNATHERELLGEKITFETNGGEGSFVYRSGMEGAEVELDYDSEDVTYDFHEKVEAYVKGDYGDMYYVDEKEVDGKVVKVYQTEMRHGQMNVIRLIEDKETHDVTVMVEVA